MATKLFAGERALVTGSASNIGRAISLALAAEEANVVLADIDADRNAAVAREIGASGGVAETITCDLSNRDGWQQIVEALGSRVPNMLVHAACPPRREVDHAMTVTEATWDNMVDTSARAGFFLAREVANRMIANGVCGRILLITSLHARSPRNLPHYSVAKAGQNMVVKELARALGPHSIRVNALAPGAVPGGGFDAAAFDFSDKIALGRLGTGEDIAGMAVALLSDRFAGYVTGTTVDVDGGLGLFNWIPPHRT